jgi:tetratricopeptide (TPR) repeat protein
MSMERSEEAMQDFNRAIELDPKDDWSLYLRSLTSLVLYQADCASDDLVKAIQLSQQEQTKKPDNHRNTFNLAVYHLVAGNLLTALEFYQSALQQGATQTKIRDAIQDLKDLLQLFPNNTAAQQTKEMLEKKIDKTIFR